jgi:hypothetical protein
MLRGSRSVVSFVVVLGGLLAIARQAAGQTPIVQLLEGSDGPTKVVGPSLCQNAPSCPNVYDPPDPNLAVGPTLSPYGYFIVTVNSRLYVYRKDTRALLGSLSLEQAGGLFQTDDACPVVDPHCVYDHYADRFVVAGLNPCNPPRIFIAVSNSNIPSANPTDWTVAEHTPTNITFLDYTALGYDYNKYYITASAVQPPPGASGAYFLVYKKDLTAPHVHGPVDGSYSVHPRPDQ